MKNNIPKLRFPEFSDELECRTIQSITARIGDGLHATPLYDDSGEYYFINGNSLGNKKVSLHTAKRISKSEYIRYPNYITDQSILMSINGTIGSLSYYKNEPVLLGKSICFINVLPNVVNDFVFHYLTSEQIQKYFISELTGSTIKNLSLATIRNTKLQLPFVDEQTKIADFLTSVDDKTQQLTKKKSLLEQYRKGVMQEIFSQQIRFKDDNGSDYPNWKSDKLGDVLLFIRNNSFSRNQLNLNSGIIQNIHYGDIHTKFKNHIDVASSVIPYINDDVSIESIQNHEYCQDGDLIIADASEDYKDVGKAVEIKNIGTKKILSGLHTILARNKISFALGFKAYLMQSTHVRSQIEKIANGISVLGISKTNLANISFDYPCLEEQTKISNFIASIDDKITQVNNNLEQTKLFKKSLLQQLFI